MKSIFAIPKVSVLDRNNIEKLLSMDETLKAVEHAFKLEAEGKAIMPPKLYLDLPDYHGDFRAMPAYIDGSAGITRIKRLTKWRCAHGIRIYAWT